MRTVVAVLLIIVGSAIVTDVSRPQSLLGLFMVAIGASLNMTIREPSD